MTKYLTLAQKFQIAEAIRKVQQNGPDGLTYQPGWSDVRIARDFGVKPNQVATVRHGAFENMKGGARPAKSKVTQLAQDVQTLEQRLTKIERLLQAA